MATNNEQNTLDTKYKKHFNISLGVFIVVIILNLGLYFYNSYLEKGNIEIDKEITQIDKDILTISNDPKVSLYTMLENNKIFLTKYRNNSKITEYISNLEKLSLMTKIEFAGFNYNDGKISSQALAKDDNISLASKKIDNFLKRFRKQDQKDNYFKLGFINSFDGQKNISFNVSLEIK